MPELPEVEVTRQSFAARIAGAPVDAIWLGKPLRWPLDCEPRRLVGTTVGHAQRRGKYLWLPLWQADAQPAGLKDAEAGRGSDLVSGSAGGLLIHLGMSGSLRFFSSDLGAPPERTGHDHFELQTRQGVLRLRDPRRFGAVVWSADPSLGRVARLLSGLGPEPFDPTLTGQYLRQAWQGKRVSVKQALLAGEAVVGAGNIYACEALFSAGIDPRVAAGRVSLPRAQRLLAAVQDTLQRALLVGGTSLRDFRNADGDPGGFQFDVRVYGREGLPCWVCGTAIRRIVQGQRSTFFCPKCQRR